MPKLDTDLLLAALVGYQHQRTEINAKIADIRKKLGGRSAQDGRGGGEVPGPFPRKRRKMSAAARKRIGEAQRKRWQAYRKAQK